MKWLREWLTWQRITVQLAQGTDQRLKIVEGATREALELLSHNGDKWAMYEAIETAFMASTYTEAQLQEDAERFKRYLNA